VIRPLRLRCRAHGPMIAGDNENCSHF
jgi:hypothetical protein